MKKILKYAFVLLIAVILVLGPLSVSSNPLFLGIKGAASLFSFIQRSASLIAFAFLAVGIFVGSFKDILERMLGKWIINFHRVLGVMSLFIIFLHPFSLFVTNFLYRKIIDPFYVFSDFCLLCDPKKELYITFGRISFWLAGLFIMAAVLRKQNWWRDNWKIIHSISYFVYVLAATHAWFVGSDIHTKIYYPIYWGSIILVILSILVKVYILKKSR